jgi:hypothetical protein
MLQVLGHLLPISVAVALSSVPIMAAILILLSPNKSRTAIPFLVGWVLGLAIVATAFTLLAQVLPKPGPKQPQTLLGILEMLVGLALVVLAFVAWRRPADGGSAREPTWLRAVASFGRWTSFGFAFVLNLRPKAILLALATGLALNGGDLSVGQTAVCIAVYTVVSASTVATPIVYAMVSPARAQRWLENAQTWILQNYRVVTSIIMLMIGVVIFGDGLTRL